MLEFAPDFAAFADLHAGRVPRAGAQGAGRPLKVKMRVGRRGGPAAAAAEPERAVAERKRQRLIEEASREPAVQEALDLFGGKVVDVREAKPAQGGP